MDFILETLGKVGFDWRMGLFNLLNFLIVFYIVKRFAFEPTLRTIKERQEKAKLAVENFEISKTEVTMAQQKAQALLDEAKVEANKVREQATEDGKQIQEQMRSKAKKEIELQIAQAKKNIKIDEQEMRDRLHAETASLVVDATEKVIGEKMDKRKDEAFIKNIIETVT